VLPIKKTQRCFSEIVMSKPEVTSNFSEKRSWPFHPEVREKHVRWFRQEKGCREVSAVLRTGEKGEQREGTKTRVTQAKQQAWQIVFATLLVFLVGGEKIPVADSESFSTDSLQYAAIPDATPSLLSGYAVAA